MKPMSTFVDRQRQEIIIDGQMLYGVAICFHSTKVLRGRAKIALSIHRRYFCPRKARKRGGERKNRIRFTSLRCARVEIAAEIFARGKTHRFIILNIFY